MIFDPFPVFLPSEYRVKFVTDAWERREAAALRRRVFCDEQGIFAGDDRDAIDETAIPIVAISSFAVALSEVVGTVRIHEKEPGLWWGSRLAVAADYRRIGAIGTALIRLAVSSAHARGCRQFLRPCAEPERTAVPAPALEHDRGDPAARPAAPFHAGRPRLLPADRGCRSRLPVVAEKGRLMLGSVALDELAATLRASRGLAAKRDIAAVATQLGVSADSAVPVGDDCAAIPDGDGFLLLAIEGFMNEFVAGDPWFAGWCGVMVNVSDIAAMGGRPIAVVDAVWAASEADAQPVLAGMRDASEAFGVPIVGGHTNTRTDRGQLSVAILGRAKRLLTVLRCTARATAWSRRSICADATASRSRTGRRRPTRPPSGCVPISSVLPAIAESGSRASPPRTSHRAGSSAPR